MKLLKAKIFKPEVFFLLILILFGLVYNYHQVAFYKPVGIHQWRNCVSAAFPVNLYHGGSFFTTQTNALLSEHAASDVAVVEFPLIYFIISLFYRIFGVNEFWFRVVQVFIGFTGLIYLFKASQSFTRDWFYAAMVPLIIFTSPVFVFYLNNFIPDSVTLSITFIGFYYFVKYTSTRRFRTWLVAMLFFLLAGLTKTSSLLPFFALGGVALIDQVSHTGKDEGSYFHFEFRYIATFILVLVLVFGWYLYAKIYSDAHGGSVSKVQIRPIWKLDSETIQATLMNMKIWFSKGVYHAKYFLIFSVGLFFAAAILRKKANRFLYILTILVFAGAVSFTLLFFRSMRNHDYYQINNLFIFVPIYLTFFSVLSTALPRVYRSVWTKVVMGIVMLLLVINARDRMQFRYSERDMHYISSSKAVEMFDIEDYLRELGIERTDKVFCTPDPSLNISLYLCDQKGRTEFADYGRWSGLSFAEKIDSLRCAGFEYLIMGSREKYQDVENLEGLLGAKVGQTGGTEIFKLAEAGE